MAKGFPQIIWGVNTFQMAGLLTFIQDWGATAEDMFSAVRDYEVARQR